MNEEWETERLARVAATQRADKAEAEVEKLRGELDEAKAPRLYDTEGQAEVERLRRSVSNVEKTVTNLRRALGKALQLLVAYNINRPDLYPAETWQEVQREAAVTNLASSIHDPATRAALAEESKTK